MTERSAKHKIDEIATLFTMSRSVSSSVDLEFLLNLILQKARSIVDAKLCTLRLADRSRSRLRLASYVGLDESGAKEFSRFESGMIRKSIDGDTPFYIDDVSAYFKKEAPSCLTIHNIRSLAMIPLFSYKRRVGVLSVYISEERRFEKEDIEVLEIIASFCSMAIDNTGMLERVRKDYLNTIKTLAKIIDANDSYTHGHCDKVTRYSLAICRALKLPHRHVSTIKTASLLHDMGKIGVDIGILRKPGKLSEDEWSRIRTHPEIGAKIIDQVGFLNEVVPIVRYHHARFEGGGYPDPARRGDKIPMGARIIAVADAFDAMTSKRPYRDAMSKDEAIMELKRCSGGQFDPAVVDAFLKSPVAVDDFI